MTTSLELKRERKGRKKMTSLQRKAADSKRKKGMSMGTERVRLVATEKEGVLRHIVTWRHRRPI